MIEEWAHEPRLPFFNGVLQQPERWGGYRDAPQIYKDREHPGLMPAQWNPYHPWDWYIYLHLVLFNGKV